MKQYILMLTFLIFLPKIYAQQNDLAKYQDTIFIRHNSDWTSNELVYTTDTVVFETGMRRHYLLGTTILPWTLNQQIAKGYGIYLNKITKPICIEDASMEGFGLDSIKSVLKTDSTIVVNLNIFENCCYSFLADISIVDKSIINLIYYGYGTYCDCDCRILMTYELKTENYQDFKKIKSVMINGNRKTIRKIK